MAQDLLSKGMDAAKNVDVNAVCSFAQDSKCLYVQLHLEVLSSMHWLVVQPAIYCHQLRVSSRISSAYRAWQHQAVLHGQIGSARLFTACLRYYRRLHAYLEHLTHGHCTCFGHLSLQLKAQATQAAQMSAATVKVAVDAGLAAWSSYDKDGVSSNTDWPHKIEKDSQQLCELYGRCMHARGKESTLAKSAQTKSCSCRALV
jgi:hypothetical protein